jgi:hypothetical protein
VNREGAVQAISVDFLLYSTGGSATGNDIGVVLNWFEELKERVPTDN